MSPSIPGRRNGFSRPFSVPQISMWLFMMVIILQFLFFCSPMMPLAISIPVTVVFFFFIGAILYYGGLTQAIDPMDPFLRRKVAATHPDQEAHLSHLFYRRFNPLPPPPPPSPLSSNNNESGDSESNNNNNHNHDRGQEPQQQLFKYCWLCELQVCETSLHCRYCSKCVQGFDHHCMWLNTCIGTANYKYFFRTLISILIMQLSHTVIMIVLLIDSWIGFGSTQSIISDAWFFHASGAADGIRVVWIIFIVLNVISLCLIGQLIWLHRMLQRRRMTTYAYVVEEAAKRRDQVRMKQEISAYRTGAIADANHQGRSWDSLTLHMGRVCRSVGCVQCDPLDIPDRILKPLEAGFATSLGEANEATSRRGFGREEGEDEEVGEAAIAVKSEGVETESPTALEKNGSFHVGSSLEQANGSSEDVDAKLNSKPQLSDDAPLEKSATMGDNSLELSTPIHESDPGQHRAFSPSPEPPQPNSVDVHMNGDSSERGSVRTLVKVFEELT